ncbi:hypothetical protein HRbin21_00685 [bacterium HR21]|nr:hypothetical protein HRbin21_00685 [bacterium HR21]
MRMADFYTPEQIRRKLRRQRVLAFLLFLLGACAVAVTLLELFSRLGL